MAESAQGGDEGAAERRRHSRFFLDDVPVELRRSGILSLAGLGKVRGGVVNLSEGGIRVSVTSQLPARKTIRCRIRVERFKDPLEAVGETLWCERDLMDQRAFLVGILFRDLEPRQARKIAAMREWFASSEFKALKARRA
jgi:hypothetical protein